MNPLAPHITAYLRERLPLERRASQNTCDAYAYSFQILFAFAGTRLGIRPSDLQFEHLDAPLVTAFLEHLQTHRANSPRTRNLRLAAIKSWAPVKTDQHVPAKSRPPVKQNMGSLPRG